MLVAMELTLCLRPSSSPLHSLFKSSSHSLLPHHHALPFSRRPHPRRPGLAMAYLEKPNSFFDFINKVQGSLPIVGLLSRILSDEGGVGTDRVQFAEFCTRVERKCKPEASRAFYDFAERHGTMAKPQYVLIWCWAAALGAGLLKSEDIMMAASRLRVSYDMQYEVDNFNLLMDEAAQKRAASRSPLPFVPFESRAEKALEAICKCSIGRTSIDEEDAILLTAILCSVFPSADKAEMERLVRTKLTAPVDSNSLQDVPQIIKEEEIIEEMGEAEKTESFVQ